MASFKFRRRFLLFGLSLMLFLCTLAGFWYYLSYIYPTTSPVNSVSDFIYSKQHPHQTINKQTIAFLPYWRLDDTKYTRFDLLSEINFFSLTINKNGDFVKVVNNETDPGWRWWQSQFIKDFIAKTQITGGKFSVTFAMQKNKDIESFLGTPSAQQTFITNAITQVKTRKLDGALLDMEYNGSPSAKFRQAFTVFSQNLSHQFHTQVSHATLSIAVFPLAVREKKLVDVQAIQPYYDRFFVMNYDYYGAGSDIAGPVAPMHGYNDKKYIFDTTTAFSDFTKAVPKNKLILGIPYYGYDWAVKNGQLAQSPTLSSDDPNNYSAVISYGRMRTDKDLKLTQCHFDGLAQEPWCWYTDDKHVDHQVWFENNQSLKVKYDFVKNNNLAGVAIWTLGYDKQFPDLWDMMKKAFGE